MLTLKSMKEKIYLYLVKSNIKFIKIFIYIQIRFVFLLIKSFEFINKYFIKQTSLYYHLKYV